MGIGIARTRNWGKDAQQVALQIACETGKVSYQVRPEKQGKRLMLAASANGLTLPFSKEPNPLKGMGIRFTAEYPALPG